MLYCDKTEIEQVILNLLKNAAQAMAEASIPTPTIGLRTRREPEYALIEVLDNGPGMDENTLKRIFEPFYTTKDVGAGTGLGRVGVLFYRHRAASRPAVGDLQAGAGRLFQHSPAPDPRDAAMSDWVLIVDDETMIRENLKAYLEDEGLRVAAFESATLALGWLHSGGACRVCIMDMRLPDMDGNSAIRALRQRYPDMEFLIHTGSSSYTLPDDLRAMGLDDQRIYMKPLPDMAPLAAAVRALAIQWGGGA